MTQKAYTNKEEREIFLDKLKQENPWIKNKDFTLLQRRWEVIIDGIRYKFRPKKFMDIPAFFLERV